MIDSIKKQDEGRAWLHSGERSTPQIAAEPQASVSKVDQASGAEVRGLRVPESDSRLATSGDAAVRPNPRGPGRGVGLDLADYGTQSMRRTKATSIYRRTKNLRAVQLLLGHSKLESGPSVRFGSQWKCLHSDPEQSSRPSPIRPLNLASIQFVPLGPTVGTTSPSPSSPPAHLLQSSRNSPSGPSSSSR